MVCARCGAAAPALKTCRWRKRAEGGRTFALCDGCHAPIAGAVWIVPGPVICFGTCRRCAEWFPVGVLSERAVGGKWDAPSGLCRTCALRNGVVF